MPFKTLFLFVCCCTHQSSLTLYINTPTLNIYVLLGVAGLGFCFFCFINITKIYIYLQSSINIIIN